MKYHWYNTEPNPRRSEVGVDCGQSGWRLHAVLSENDDPKRSQPAACGLIPAHGWGLHMFIEKRCKKCERALSRMTPNASLSGLPLGKD